MDASQAATGAVSTDCRAGKLASDPALTDLVVFHKDCPDGFGAAFAAWKLLGDKATYVAADHGPAAPHSLDVRGKRVVVADYCFPAAVTQRMISEAASFIVLDHHASAEKELAGVDAQYKVFEMKQSGATLAWNYFHGADVPTFLRYLEDKDIWRWSFPDSQAFSAGFTTPFDFAAWDAVLSGGSAAIADIIARGQSVLEYRNKEIAFHVAKAVPCVMKAAPGFRGRLLNATTLVSEIGNRLALEPDVDYGFMWQFDHRTGVFTCSLRSASDAVDVSVIAKSLGGGGHRRAAGFSYRGVSIDELFESIDGKRVDAAGADGAGKP